MSFYSRIVFISIACVIISGLVGSLVYFYILQQNLEFPENFLPEYIEAFNVTNSRAQNLSYQVMLFSLFIFSLIGLPLLWLSRSGHLHNLNTLFQLGAIIGLYLCTLFPALFGLPTMLFGYRYELLYNQCLVLGGVAAVFGVGILAHKTRRAPTATKEKWVYSFFIIYTIIIFYPHFYSPLVPLGGEPIIIDWHFDSVLGPASQIAEGFKDKDIISTTYGVLWVSIIAFFEKLIGNLDFGSYLRIVQVSQLAFWILVILCFRVWRPNHLLAPIVCLMLLAMYLTPDMRITGFPNHTGIRSVGFPLGALILILSRKMSPLGLSLILGISWGILLLINFETAVCIGLGYVAFIILRQAPVLTNCQNRFISIKLSLSSALRSLPGLAISGILFLSSAAVVFGLYLILYWIVFGFWPSELQSYLSIINSGTGGYFGLPFYMDPWAIVIYFSAAYLLVTNFYRCALKGFAINAGLEAAFAVTLLIWLQYYVNRPEPWQLWTHLFVFCLMMSRFLSSRYIFLLKSPKWRMRALPSAALMAFIIFPCILAKNPETRPQGLQKIVKSAFTSPEIKTFGCSQISGIYVNPEYAAKNLEMSEFLKNKSNSEPLAYIAMNGFLIAREVGPSSLPNSIFFRLCSAERMQVFLDHIHKTKPEVIFIESAPDNVEKKPDISILWHRLALRIKNGIQNEYVLADKKNGWEIWEKHKKSL